MKKSKIIQIIMTCVILCLLTACSDRTEQTTGSVADSGTAVHESASEQIEVQEESEVDRHNRTILAEALNLDENARNLRFLLMGLEDLNMGALQQAEATEADGQSALKVTAEDGTQYLIYLTASGNMDAVQNIATEEWVFMLVR